VAIDAAPPSPLYKLVPFPASVVMMPVEAFTFLSRFLEIIYILFPLSTQILRGSNREVQNVERLSMELMPVPLPATVVINWDFTENGKNEITRKNILEGFRFKIKRLIMAGIDFMVKQYTNLRNLFFISGIR
jgi:hypothetical protein